MSILESIRKRAGLLVLAIGASMVIFVLEDALTSGRFFFGGNENTVAVVNGKKLDYNTLKGKIDEMADLQKVSAGVEALDNETYNQTVHTAYQSAVADMLLKPMCKNLGISVPDSEITDLLLGSHPAPELTQYFTDRQTGQLYKDFVDPRTGRINTAVVAMYLKQLNDKDRAKELASWTLFEYQFRDRQLQNKYFSLISNALFVTDAQAKQVYEDDNKYYNISYVVKKYSDVADNSITVTDQDIQSYYNQHAYEYEQSEESRKIDYVTFFAAPTDKDLADLNKQVDSVASRLKKSKPEEDSALIVAESDDHFLDPHYHKKGAIDPTIDSIMSNSDKGFVYGPYKENNAWRIAKVLNVQQMPDSAKLRIIAIPGVNNDLTKAKALADSLKGILTPDNFAAMAQKFSQDGTAQKGGDLGWLQQEKVPADILSAGFMSDKGEIKEMQSQGAYLLVYAEDQSPKQKFIKVGVITKKIGPSQETTSNVYSQASSFAGKHPTTESFEPAADQMNKRVADLKENDEKIAGLQTPKDLIRWVYQAKAGDVSNAFDVGGDRYVVAHVVQILPMGTAPLSLVKDLVKPKALQEKKAEKLIADMKSAMQGVHDITTLGQKTGLTPSKTQRMLFQTYSVPGLGKEDALLGVMSGTKPQTLSQPFAGQLGVFVIQVDSVYTPNQLDVKQLQEQQQEALRYRVQNDAFDAMEKKAGLVSHLGKFY